MGFAVDVSIPAAELVTAPSVLLYTTLGEANLLFLPAAEARGFDWYCMLPESSKLTVLSAAAAVVDVPYCLFHRSYAVSLLDLLVVCNRYA